MDISQIGQIGGGVALGLAALRLAEKGIALAHAAFKQKMNGHAHLSIKTPPRDHNEAVLAELRSINSNLEKHASRIDTIHETTTWLKNREEWKGAIGQ